MNSLGVIGECMLELREQDDGFALGYGGDVFNTAVYAVRTGLDVSFISAIGDDHYSDYLLAAWQKEGVGIQSVRILEAQTPALYIIQTDANGERSFHYWRDSSPFKKLLAEGKYLDSLPEVLATFSCVYFSGISLALLSVDDRELLLKLLTSYRNMGGKVAFDSNYRPRLWASANDAQIWIDRAYALSDTAFPSQDDEAALRGEHSAEALINRISDLGVDEIVLKDGASGATVKVGDTTHKIAADPVEQIVDTTAAGDSFNGAYLASRLNGSDAATATSAGCKAAAKVIQFRGAIIPSDVNLAD